MPKNPRFLDLKLYFEAKKINLRKKQPLDLSLDRCEAVGKSIQRLMLELACIDIS
jgi:hypothetical protein